MTCTSPVHAVASAADTTTTDAAPRLTGLVLVLLARAPRLVASTGLGPVLVPLSVEVGGGWGRSRGGSGAGPVADAGQHRGEDVHKTTMRRRARSGKGRRQRLGNSASSTGRAGENVLGTFARIVSECTELRTTPPIEPLV